MSIAGASYTSNQDNSVSIRQTFINQTFPSDSVKRGVEKISLRLQRIQNAATMSSNIIGLGSENGVSEPVLTVWKAAGNGATHEIIIPVKLTTGSTITATGRLNVGTGQTLGIPMRLTVENDLSTNTFNSDFTITSTTDGSTTFTATGTTAVDWDYIRLRIRINGAFTAQGDPQITTELGTMSLTVTNQLGNTTSIKVALFEDGVPLAVSTGVLAKSIATSMTVYDFSFPTTPIVDANKTLSAIVFADGDTSAWSDTLTTIKVSIDATASTYTLGFAKYYLSGAYTYTPTGVAGTYDQTTTDMYFALFYTDVLPTNDDLENIYWTCDCDQQAAAILELLTTMDELADDLYYVDLPQTLQVEQNTTPILTSFEDLWGSSPIPQNKNLLWQNTQENKFGGQFVYIPDDQKIYLNQNEHVRGYPVPINMFVANPTSGSYQSATAATYASWAGTPFKGTFVLNSPTMFIINLFATMSTNLGTVLKFDYIIKAAGATPTAADLQSVVTYGQTGTNGIIGLVAMRTYNIEWQHPTELAAGAYDLYINFHSPSTTQVAWELGYGPGQASSVSSLPNYPIILCEGYTKWRIQ